MQRRSKLRFNPITSQSGLPHSQERQTTGRLLSSLPQLQGVVKMFPKLPPICQSVTKRISVPQRRKCFSILHKYPCHSCCRCTLTKSATWSCRCKIRMSGAALVPLHHSQRYQTPEKGSKSVYNFLRERRKRCLEDFIQNMLQALPFFNLACKIRHKTTALSSFVFFTINFRDS